jgi:hypothetical protein
MAEKVIVTMYDGEDRTITIALREDLDISGWAVAFRVFHPVTLAQLFEKTIGSGVVVLANTAGDRRWRVTLDSADTAGLADGHPMEFVRTDAGAKIVLSIGPLLIKSDQSF